MNFGFILRIAKKDWKEILNNRQFLIPIITMPIVIGVVLPLAFSFIYGSVLVSLVNTVLKPLLLIIPAMLSMIIASDSIAGEKERKTIESLLILPLSDRELIIGKVFSSLFPAFLGSLLAFLSMGLTINITAASLLNGQIVIFTDPTWWILLLLLIPIVAFIQYPVYGLDLFNCEGCTHCNAIFHVYNTSDIRSDNHRNYSSLYLEHSGGINLCDYCCIDCNIPRLYNHQTS